jgi:hypothetical protein
MSTSAQCVGMNLLGFILLQQAHGLAQSTPPYRPAPSWIKQLARPTQTPMLRPMFPITGVLALVLAATAPPAVAVGTRTEPEKLARAQEFFASHVPRQQCSFPSPSCSQVELQPAKLFRDHCAICHIGGSNILALDKTLQVSQLNSDSFRKLTHSKCMPFTHSWETSKRIRFLTRKMSLKL